MPTFKTLVFLLIILATASFTAINNSVLKNETIRLPLIIHSSDQDLNKAFNWAQEKALSYVQTGKTGPINAWENGPGTDTVNYLPSYWAGYPKRTAFYSRDFCHQLEGAHFLGLEAENFTMMKAFAASANSSKKWFPLWAINFDGSPYTIDYKSDSNFVREVPATFELVEKAHELYCWTGDDRYIQDPNLWEFYEKSVSEFIELHDQQIPNGIAEGTGKGIFDGAASYNEQKDQPLIEAGDALASQYKAYLAFAQFAQLKGDEKVFHEFSLKAEQLKNLFNESWGIKNTPLYNRGYLANGTPVDGWGKENSWFMPMKGITEFGSDRTLNYLTFIDERLESKADIPDNIEAISYIPEMFFLHHQNELGWKWLTYILEKLDQEHSYSSATGRNGDYPEVSYVFIRNVIIDLLGVKPNAAKNEVRTLSHLPTALEFLGVENITLGSSKLAVHHEGITKSTLNYQTGTNPLTWNAEFLGTHPELLVNGKKVKAQTYLEEGVVKSSVVAQLSPGEAVTIQTVN